jgi:hypothetical protein
MGQMRVKQKVKAYGEHAVNQDQSIMAKELLVLGMSGIIVRQLTLPYVCSHNPRI